MWVTLFALATAASVWFSAAKLAVQLRQEQAVVNSAIESREKMPDVNKRFSSATAGKALADRLKSMIPDGLKGPEPNSNKGG
jgi:hypothetical protein